MIQCLNPLNIVVLECDWFPATANQTGKLDGIDGYMLCDPFNALTNTDNLVTIMADNILKSETKADYGYTSDQQIFVDVIAGYIEQHGANNVTVNVYDQTGRCVVGTATTSVVPPPVPPPSPGPSCIPTGSNCALTLFNQTITYNCTQPPNTTFFIGAPDPIAVADLTTSISNQAANYLTQHGNTTAVLVQNNNTSCIVETDPITVPQCPTQTMYNPDFMYTQGSGPNVMLGLLPGDYVEFYVLNPPYSSAPYGTATAPFSEIVEADGSVSVSPLDLIPLLGQNGLVKYIDYQYDCPAIVGYINVAPS